MKNFAVNKVACNPYFPRINNMLVSLSELVFYDVHKYEYICAFQRYCPCAYRRLCAVRYLFESVIAINFSRSSPNQPLRSRQAMPDAQGSFWKL